MTKISHIRNQHFPKKYNSNNNEIFQIQIKSIPNKNDAHFLIAKVIPLEVIHSVRFKRFKVSHVFIHFLSPLSLYAKNINSLQHTLRFSLKFYE